MPRTYRLPGALMAGVALGIVAMLAVEVGAQSGAVRGKMVDPQGEPLEGVEIVMAYQEGARHELKVTSNEQGEFLRVGLRPGHYLLSFRKAGYKSASRNVQVGLGSPLDMGRVVMEKLSEGDLAEAEDSKRLEEAKRHFDTGVAAVEAEDYEAALEAFQEALRVAPDFPEAHFNMGYVYSKLVQPDRVIRSFEKAVTLRPDYVDAWVELGKLYNAQKDYTKALEAFEKAVDIRDSDVAVLYNCGAVAINAGERAKAQEAFGRVLALEPDHPLANFQMGMMMVQQARNDEAIAYLERYLELDPEGPQADTAKGVLAALKKR